MVYKLDQHNIFGLAFVEEKKWLSRLKSSRSIPEAKENLSVPNFKGYRSRNCIVSNVKPSHHGRKQEKGKPVEHQLV